MPRSQRGPVRLTHPEVTNLDLLDVLHALSDPTRMTIVQTLRFDSERACGTFPVEVAPSTLTSSRLTITKQPRPDEFPADPKAVDLQRARRVDFTELRQARSGTRSGRIRTRSRSFGAVVQSCSLSVAGRSPRCSTSSRKCEAEAPKVFAPNEGTLVRGGSIKRVGLRGAQLPAVRQPS